MASRFTAAPFSMPVGQPASCHLALVESLCDFQGDGSGAETMVTRDMYREAMARLGAAVNVITTDGPAGRRGFTASAVCSVTDTPPTILVCCNRRNDTHPALLINRVMCVNTLSAGQTGVSDIFAGAQEGEARFDSGQWHELHTGAPALLDAVVSFDCRIVQITDVGTHSVIFGEVVAIAEGSGHNGLMYFGRAYHPLAHPGQLAQSG